MAHWSSAGQVSFSSVKTLYFSRVTHLALCTSRACFVKFGLLEILFITKEQDVKCYSKTLIAERPEEVAVIWLIFHSFEQICHDLLRETLDTIE